MGEEFYLIEIFVSKTHEYILNKKKIRKRKH